MCVCVVFLKMLFTLLRVSDDGTSLPPLGTCLLVSITFKLYFPDSGFRPIPVLLFYRLRALATVCVCVCLCVSVNQTKIIITDGFGNRTEDTYTIFPFTIYISSLSPPYVCSHQFSGDFYKSFVAHKKTRCKGRRRRRRRQKIWALRVFPPSPSSDCSFSPVPTQQFSLPNVSLCLFYHQHTNIANTSSSVRLSDLHHLYRCQKERRSIKRTGPKTQRK